MDKNPNQSNNPPMLYRCLTEAKKDPEDNVRKIETCKSFDAFCEKINIILTNSAFVGIA